MKKTILAVFFISTIVTLTLLNVNLRKDSTNIDIKIQHTEALGANESGNTNLCTKPGGICMTFDEERHPVFYAGLSIP